jgi:hypothetical protein
MWQRNTLYGYWTWASTEQGSWALFPSVTADTWHQEEGKSATILMTVTALSLWWCKGKYKINFQHHKLLLGPISVLFHILQHVDALSLWWYKGKYKINFQHHKLLLGPISVLFHILQHVDSYWTVKPLHPVVAFLLLSGYDYSHKFCNR